MPSPLLLPLQSLTPAHIPGGAFFKDRNRVGARWNPCRFTRVKSRAAGSAALSLRTGRQRQACVLTAPCGWGERTPQAQRSSEHHQPCLPPSNLPPSPQGLMVLLIWGIDRKTARAGGVPSGSRCPSSSWQDPLLLRWRPRWERLSREGIPKGEPIGWEQVNCFH